MFSCLFYVLTGLLIYPCTLLMCKILHLDKDDTQVMIFTSIPTSIFCIILGIGVFIGVY